MFILFINIYVVFIVCRLQKFFEKGNYDKEKKDTIFCCCLPIKVKIYSLLKYWIIFLTFLHISDSVLTLSSPIANLIYLSKSDHVFGLLDLYTVLIISRFIRNTIDLIMGLSFLFLAKRVSERIYPEEKVAETVPVIKRNPVIPQP